MGEEFGISHPSEAGERAAGDGQAVDAGIGERDRLDIEGGEAVDDAEQGGFEGEGVHAVGIGAFGEEDQPVSGGEAGGDGVSLAGGFGAAIARDIDGAGQRGELADRAPAGDIGLGDEGGVGDAAAEQGDIGPAEMIGDEQQWAFGGLAVEDDAQAQSMGQRFVEQMRERAGAARRDAAAQQLCGDEKGRGGERAGQGFGGAEALMRGQVFLSSGTA